MQPCRPPYPISLKQEATISSIRRVVTGHTSEGTAIVTHDGPAANVKHRQASGIYSTLLWMTDASPADNTHEGDAADRELGTAPPPAGTIFRIVDFPPPAEIPSTVSHDAVLKEMGIAHAPPADAAARSPFMHRTESVDYALVLTGENDMLHDDSEVHLRTGDVVVQRGTNHAWVNRGTEWCRIAFVLVGAKPRGG
jgi:hypothetical protein